MDALWTPFGIGALCTALAGVVVFGCAPRLPSLFPPAIIRLIGFMTVGAALAPIWALTIDPVKGNYLPLPALVVGGACLAAMVVIHLLQTRKHPAPDAPADGNEAPATADDSPEKLTERVEKE